MIEGLKGLLGSKKALAGGALVIGATVLTALGTMSIEDWQSYTRWLAVAYFGAETVNGVAATLKGATKGKE